MKECQHALKSLPLTELRTLHYVCLKCETFIDAYIDLNTEILGRSFHDMHTQIAQDLGGTYEGSTTYDQVREYKTGESV